MRRLVVLLAFAMIAFGAKSQDLTPARILLKNGETIQAHHFGQLHCSGTDYFKSFILIKGMYLKNVTEIDDYSKISRIDLINFTKPAVTTGENEKGTIIITKKDGVEVTLNDADISLSCYGVGDKKNQIKVQTINPLTEEVVETSIDTKDIQTIFF